MFLGLTLSYWLTMHGLVTVLAVLFYVIASHLMHQRRHPTAAIAWVLFMLLMPYLALPAFLTFGSRKQPRPRALSAPEPAQPDAGQPWAVQTLLALAQPAPSSYRDLNLHDDGHAALAALWRAIDQAEHTLDICTFILGRDALGSAVIGRLREKARAGVTVRLLLDGLGSLMSGRPSFKALRRDGVQVTLFVPPLHSPLKGRTNLRDHRKMLIADAGHDACRLWCGGRNLAAEYFEGSPGHAPWHDLSFDLGGDFVQQAVRLFERDWAFANGVRRSDAQAAPGTAAAPTPADAWHAAQLVASGPDQVDDTVHALLVTAAYRARRRITLVTPYFVPDAALLMALCLAARRGVRVELLLPAKSNHPMSDVARRRALRSLAQAGGRIGLLPYMQHAKAIVIDDALALAGSANLDSRSLFLNYEMMVAFHDPADVGRFAAWFEHEWRPAVPYRAKNPGLIRDIFEGLVLWVGFQL